MSSDLWYMRRGHCRTREAVVCWDSVTDSGAAGSSNGEMIYCTEEINVR